MARIVILGGSFGGLTTAFQLKSLLGRKAEITVISDEDNFIFIPSLPWLSFGWRRREDISLPIRPVLEKKGIAFIHAPAQGVDPDSSKVFTSQGEFSYDYLVIATGPYLAFEEVPNLGPEKGYTECIFTLPQAERCFKAWQAFLEDPGPVIVGAVQGVSCFGPAYEYLFEIDSELRRRKIRHKVPITFITSEPYLGHFGMAGLGRSRRWMEDEFAERDIRFLTNQAIEEFTPEGVRLKDGTRLPFRLAMFAPPMKGVPAVQHLGNPRGFIPVDKNYRHQRYKNIFSAGVAVAIAPPESTPVPTGVPKTGYMTVKMARIAALTIAREIRNEPLPPAEEIGAICILDMGRTAAYMKSFPVLPPRQEAVIKKGLWAKALKIAFERYFLWKIRHGISHLP
jgi:sulfide:quinone oxidoreductase